MLCILMVNQKNAMRENFTINTVYFSSNFRAEICRAYVAENSGNRVSGRPEFKISRGRIPRTPVHMRGF